MIRRKSVSPISALIQDERRIKGKHEFFIIRASGSEQAEIPRPNPAIDAPPSLQSADRGSLYWLDSALYSFSRQAAPERFHRKQHCQLSKQSRGKGASCRFHSKPGT